MISGTNKRLGLMFLLFFLTVVAFAIIYQNHSGEFKNTAIYHENYYSSSESGLGAYLAQVVLQFSNIYRTEADKHAKYQVDHIYSPSIIFPRVLIRAELLANISGGHSGGRSRAIIDFEFDLASSVNDSIRIIRTSSIPPVVFESINGDPRIDGWIHFGDFRILKIESDRSIVGFYLDRQSNGGPVIDFVNVYSGDPAGQHWGFWHSLYLSVVTISTLGFGDIIPVTFSGRMIIMAQVLIGIFFVGYIINLFSKNSSSN